VDSSSIAVLLQKLGCEKISFGSSWVRSTCPLASWRHSGLRDRHPSFAVSISPNNTSSGNCLACGWKGGIIPLLWYLDGCGQEVDRLIPFVLANDQPDCSEKEDAVVARKVKSSAYWGPPKPLVSRFVPPPENKPLPEERLKLLRSAIPPAVLEHLRVERRITDAASEHWELGYSRRMHRIVIPLRTHDGVLVGMSGRALGTRGPKYLHYPKGFKRNHLLYGGDKVKLGQVGYLHEGFFSCIYAWQFGYDNCVARMGTHLSGDQEDLLVKWFDRLVIVPDGDAPGYRSADEIHARMRERMPVEIAPMPTGLEVDRLSEEELRKIMGPCKSEVDMVVSKN
jgi:hypothetical protein